MKTSERITQSIQHLRCAEIELLQMELELWATIKDRNDWQEKYENLKVKFDLLKKGELIEI